MSPALPLANPSPFESVVARALEIVTAAAATDWTTANQLNELDDPIYVKNAERVLVHVNDAFSHFFSPDASPIGRLGAAFLETSIADVSKSSDELISGGSTSLQFEHVGRGPDGRAYRLHSRKLSLVHLGNPGIAMLGITRVLAVVPDAEALPQLDVVDKHLRFRSLSEVDREIAKQIGHGKKVREVADSLGLTTRAVEQRKRKILASLDLEQTLDLVKLLVRMQDRGLIDLGL